MKNACLCLLLLSFTLHAEEPQVRKFKFDHIVGISLREAIRDAAGKGEKVFDLFGEPLVDADLEGIGELNTIEEFDLRGVTGYGSNVIGDEGLKSIAKSKSIKRLRLGALTFTDVGLQYLAVMTQLELLELDSNDLVTGAGLAQLSNLTQLKSLNLFNCRNLKGDDLQHLKKMTKLEKLIVRYMPGLNDAAMGHLAGLTQLRELDFRESAPEITDLGLEHLKNLNELTSLVLFGMNGVTDVGLQSLRHHPKLRTLVLQKLPNVTDAGVAVIGELLELVELPISDAALEQVKKLKNLEKGLFWSLHPVSPDGLTVLGQLPKLSSMRSNMKLSNVALEALASIKSFKIPRFDVDDEGVKILSALPEIQEIDLADSATDASLELLAHMKSLKYVCIGYHPSVTPKGVAKLRAQLPDCKVSVSAEDHQHRLPGEPEWVKEAEGK